MNQSASDSQQQAEQQGFRDFFGALRWIESQNPEWSRIGCAVSPEDEPVRFGQPATLAFATRSTEPFHWEGNKPKLDVHFFGLLGPNGPMPAHITEFIRDRQHNEHDATLAAFLDIFHHRFVELFYRAWAVNQKAVDFDRPSEAKFTHYFGSLFGIGSPALQNRDSLPDRAKYYFAGHLSRQTRNVEGLESILSDYFLIPVTIETMVGHWMEIPVEAQCRLGEDPANSTLGHALVVGARTWDAQNRFRVIGGPLTYERYLSLMPGTPGFTHLLDWVRLYTSGELQWDLQLILQQEEIPPTILGQGAYLGWTCWVGEFESDSDDFILIDEPIPYDHLSEPNPS